jgi:hypothetical protein
MVFVEEREAHNARSLRSRGLDILDVSWIKTKGAHRGQPNGHLECISSSIYIRGKGNSCVEQPIGELYFSICIPLSALQYGHICRKLLGTNQRRKSSSMFGPYFDGR